MPVEVEECFCLEEISFPVARMPGCNHKGHQECVQQWTQTPDNILRSSWSCPWCRAEFSILLIQKEDGSEEVVDPKVLPSDLYKWEKEEDLYDLGQRLQREDDERTYERMFGVDWRNDPVAQNYVRELEEQYRRAWANMRPG